jgi:hypothetical protein
MKTLPIALALLAILTAHGAPVQACGRDSDCPDITFGDSHGHLASRHDWRDARLAITPETGEVVLILTDDVIAVQLSDRTLRRVRREMKNEEDEGDDAVLAHAIKIAVLSSVRALLSSSAEYPIRELRDVEYRNGRLIFTRTNGERLLQHMHMNGRDLMAGFAESDARQFVDEFHRVQARSR